MGDNNLPISDERIELRFKDFMKKLLDAQSYDFMKERELFSRDTLETILDKFCDIIAKEVDCESCTIHLQLYDSAMMDKEPLKECIIGHLLKAANSFEGPVVEKGELSELPTILKKIVNPGTDREKKESLVNLSENFREYVKARIDVLTGSLTFPYWAYARGVASLVALNENSPWSPVREDKKSKLKYIAPYSGVSKFIFMENMAKVRDRLSIRETRDFKKLGTADLIVWNNTGWKYVFKNYYGVPIRIHSGGEVVGILKAENKRTYWADEKGNRQEINKDITRILSSEDLITGVKDLIKKKIGENNKNLDSLNVSFLSLVYLEEDIITEECGRNTNLRPSYEELLFIPYPECEHVRNVLKKYEKKILHLLKNTDKKMDHQADSKKEPGKDQAADLQAVLKEEPVTSDKWKELFKKKNRLCKIFRNFIDDFYYREAEIQEMADTLGKIELDSAEADFKKDVLEILERFDKKIEIIKNRGIKSLKPVGDTNRPPMQLYTRTIDDERKLWNLLMPEKNYDDLYDKIREFYSIFKNSVYQNIHNYYLSPKFKLDEKEKKSFEEHVEEIIIKETKVEASVDNWQNPNLKLPDFHFKITLKFIPTNNPTEPTIIDFYMVVLPTREEIGVGNILGDKKEDYEQVNRFWLDKSADEKNTLENYCHHRRQFFEKVDIEVKGEQIIFNGSEIVTDFILDRQAARIQAFADALPLAEFTFDDTYKLTWAAYEIGKLIEREISYRANRYVNPIPLTAMEFYRIPISDLSFVDELITRRTSLDKIAGDIDVYIKKIILEMDMADEVEYSSRIKGYRSMFQRIGERFEGYVRGNIALWVFLLSLIAAKDKETQEKVEQNENNDNRNERKKFFEHLGKFRERIIESMDQEDAKFFKNYLTGKKLKSLYGDLKFDSAPFLDDKNLLALYQTKKDVEDLFTSGKSEEVVRELRVIIRYQEIEIRDNFQIGMLKDLIDKVTDRNSTDFKESLDDIKTVLGGIFRTEIEKYKKKLIDAFNRIRINLEKEGLKKGNFQDIDQPKIIKLYFKKNRGLLTDLLLENYSYFIRDSLSLLIQIANLLRSLEMENDDIEDFKNFRIFYRKCRELREFLCSPPHQLENKEKYHLGKIFGMGKTPGSEGNVWTEIKEFIGRNATDSVFNTRENDYLSLTPKSIYRRIRLLNYILHRQIPAAMLDWELGRFDIFGIRMNCLFKNQVFVLSEKIWNKGDPFFFYLPDADRFEKYSDNSNAAAVDPNRHRQRWLCLRTKLLQGEYNASQIVALIDPKSAEPGYWEHGYTYNLKGVQYVLGKIFDEFEGKSALRYKYFSWHRHLVSQCHHKWYKYKSSLLQKDTQHENKIPEKARWFGSFLFSGVINLLLLLLRCTIDHENKSANQNRYGLQSDTLEIIDAKMRKKSGGNFFYCIIQYLYYGIESGINYSDKIKNAFMENKLLSQIPFECNCNGEARGLGRYTNKLLVCLHEQKKESSCHLYNKAKEFVEEIIKDIEGRKNNNPLNDPNKHRLIFDMKIFAKIEANLQEEMEFFATLDQKESIDGFQKPLFFIDRNQKDRFGHQTLGVFKNILEGLKKRLLNGKKIEINYWGFIYRTLERIRREQNSYLFDMGDKTNDYAGLWMRDKKEILERIKNYVLLYSEQHIDPANKDRFPGWNAHDLYYYLHSLIPTEIQVRTELTNTFAVQYHDSIYKVQPSPGTAFPHAMIKNTGEGLERLDRELEIDYEDYILKYRRHEIDEEEKDQEEEEDI